MSTALYPAARGRSSGRDQTYVGLEDVHGDE
jgi:hypothetical protein